MRKVPLADSQLLTRQERGWLWWMRTPSSRHSTFWLMIFCKSQLPAGKPPGPKPSLTGSEVITLVIFSQ